MLIKIPIYGAMLNLSIFSLHQTIQKAREAVAGYIERKKKLSLHNMAKF